MSDSRSGEIRREKMRIAGREVAGHSEGEIEVRYPYDGRLVGTVPCASATQVAKAFVTAAAYKPRLTRYERQRILLCTAELLHSRREEISDLITLETGLSKKDSCYEVGRAIDVFTLTGHLCMVDDGEAYACDLTPHGQQRRILGILRLNRVKKRPRTIRKTEKCKEPGPREPGSEIFRLMLQYRC